MVTIGTTRCVPIMNWQIELLSSPEIRLVIGAVLIALLVGGFAAAWASRRIWQRAVGSGHRRVERETRQPGEATGRC